MRCTSLLVGLLAAASTVSSRALGAHGPRAATRAAKALAGNLMSYYNGADNGALPSPYAWWESAGMWATMIQYWHNTGDATYNNDVAMGIAAQAGSGQNFIGPNTLGNDDQLWWGIAAITAAEYGFQEPSGASWVQLAENVFNDVQQRWNTATCNGGLGWQISTSAPGYNYKNSISNGLFFQLAARLARFTGNSMYEDWATKIFDWTYSVKLINHVTYMVYDGTDATQGCTELNHLKWTYNVGVFMYGAAVMLDHTGDAATWQPHVDGFIGAAQKKFTDSNILQEDCEAKGDCNTDQLSFKAYLSRWLAATAALVPSTQPTVLPMLQASVNGALASCNGGPNQNTCGIQWPINAYDDLTGVGQQMAALEIVQGLLANGKGLPAKSWKAKKRDIGMAFEA